MSRFLQSVCSFSGQKRAVNSLWFPSFFLLSIQVKLQLAFVGNAFPTLPPLSWICQREMALTALFTLLWKTLPCQQNCTNWMDIVLRCRSQYSKEKKIPIKGKKKHRNISAKTKDRLKLFYSSGSSSTTRRHSTKKKVQEEKLVGNRNCSRLKLKNSCKMKSQYLRTAMSTCVKEEIN